MKMIDEIFLEVSNEFNNDLTIVLISKDDFIFQHKNFIYKIFSILNFDKE